MPLFSSLRSKKSRRPSVASQASGMTAPAAGANEHGALSTKGSRSSIAVASQPASTTASPRAPARDSGVPAAAATASPALAQQQQHSTPPLPQGAAASTPAAAPAQPAGPRPSELFAGKGVQ